MFVKYTLLSCKLTVNKYRKITFCLVNGIWFVFFSHLCLYEIGFLPMLETSILHDHGSPRNNPLKCWRKRIHHKPVHAG